jgi:chemotaxis protein CheD
MSRFLHLQISSVTRNTRVNANCHTWQDASVRPRRLFHRHYVGSKGKLATSESSPSDKSHYDLEVKTPQVHVSGSNPPSVTMPGQDACRFSRMWQAWFPADRPQIPRGNTQQWAAHCPSLLHYQLPTASADPQRASEKPLMYADSGMKILMELMARNGAEKRRMQVHLAGGANMLNDRGLFDIGRRNHASIRKILWQNGMLINAEHVGGTAPRNMEISVSDGAVVIKCNSERIAI